MYTAIPAGQLIHRVTIIRRSVSLSSQNEVGETDPQDYPTQTRWAKIETPSAIERYRAAEVYEDVTHIVTMRYTPDLSPADALKFQGKTYDISSMIDPDERHIDLILMCNEQLRATN